jgi:Xaa-Pro aminopeptidase
MYLSSAEKERRYQLVREQMKKENVNSILVVGNTAIGGPLSSGNFCYLTDFFMISNYGLLLFSAESDPVMWVGNEITEYQALKNSWISDVRVSNCYAPDVVKVVKERERTNGRLGISSMENLPASTYRYLQENLPSWEFIDADPILLNIKFSKSAEEQLFLKKAAELVDNGFQAALKVIRPGIKERDIVGVLDGFHRGCGSDRTFNLILSGPFPRSNKKEPPIQLWYPSNREIKKGDVILLEMTATYGGYWNQLVRAVSVGGENRELSFFHKAILKSIEAGVKSMKPGVQTSDFVAKINKCAEEMGYKLTIPVGHYVGLDLVEARINPGINLILKQGTPGIVHPILVDRNGDRMFWGQTYLVVENETIQLNSTGDELVVVS